MKIEFLKAYEDGTWDTEELEVPDDVFSRLRPHSDKWESAITHWVTVNYGTMAEHRKVVLWSIYHIPEKG